MAMLDTRPASGRNISSHTRSRTVTAWPAGRLSPGSGMSTRSVACSTEVANTRRIGWAKLPAEYCVNGLAFGKPQSHGGARRTLLEASRWMAMTVIAVEAAMNRNTSRPL